MVEGSERGRRDRYSEEKAVVRGGGVRYSERRAADGRRRGEGRLAERCDMSTHTMKREHVKGRGGLKGGQRPVEGLNPRGVVEGRRGGRGMAVELINVDGLTEIKLRELEEKFFINEEDYKILCIVETHHRWVRYDVLEGLDSFTAMRTTGEKKGGVCRLS